MRTQEWEFVARVPDENVRDEPTEEDAAASNHPNVTFAEQETAGPRAARGTNNNTRTNDSSSSVVMDEEDSSSDDDSLSDKQITEAQMARYRTDFGQDASAQVAQNAVSNTTVTQLALNRNLLQGDTLSPYFGINLDQGGMPATNQRDSGRCWMFGLLNLFRFGTCQKLGVGNFEFSESYLYFYHMLEQCNTFLELVLETTDKPTDDRLLAQFLEEPIADAGDWQIAVNLVKKYGVVPKSVYPESDTSGDTSEMVAFLIQLLVATAVRMRQSLEDGNGNAAARNVKAKTMANAWRILCIHLGTPPQQFDWQWRDVQGNSHRHTGMTPRAFGQEFVTVPYAQYVSLIQDPRHEYYQRYTVERSETVVGGDKTIFLNVPAEEMKSMSQAMLQDGLPAWFACNVDTELDEDSGLWDAKLYEFEALYGISTCSTKMSKADRIRYGSPMGTHVMLFTGVDVVEEEDTKEDGHSHCRRWRVENSWGTEDGNDGYFTMNDNWFDEYIFEVVAPPKYLSDEAVAGLETEPVVLPCWDPMSSVVGRRRHRRR